MADTGTITTQSSEKARPKRSWWRFLRPRFSLRTMLAMITVVCILIPTWILPSVRQYRVANQLNAEGGYWAFTGETIDEDNRQPQVHHWYEHFFRSIDAILVHWSDHVEKGGKPLFDWPSLPHLRRVTLRTFRITTDEFRIAGFLNIDGLLEQLTASQEIRYLKIERFKLTDESMRLISQLTNLETLEADADVMTRVGLKELLKLKNLQSLSFGLVKNDDRLTVLSEMPQLKKLSLTIISDDAIPALRYLKDTRFAKEFNFYEAKDDALASIGDLMNVEVAIFPQQSITDKGLRHLKNLTQLKKLSISTEHITTEGLKNLTAMQNLEWLNLYNNPKIDGESIDDLLRLKKLETLRIGRTSISAEDAKRLIALPNIKLITIGSPIISPEDQDKLISKYSVFKDYKNE